MEPPREETPPPARAQYVPPTERADRVWHRVLGIGLILAIVLHLALLLAVRSSRLPPSPFAAAGPAQMGDYRAAAGGGGGAEMVQVAEERQQPVEEVVPEPVPELEAEIVIEPQPLPEPTPLPDVAIAAPGTGTAGQLGTTGEQEGPGTETGTGLGAGGSAEAGRSGIIAPVPRGMILPPSERPRNVRGREITVWVFVTDQGRVVADSTRLDPPTPDTGYNRRLMRSAAEWSFEPARRAGRAIAAWYPYQIIL